MKDSFGRDITYARISVTDLCNMRCKYCMPDGIEKKPHEAILSIEQLIKVSDALAELGVSKQRITGGEPLVRRGLLSLLQHIGGNEKVGKLAITTNAQLLEGMAKLLYEAGVRALNVSLDTLDKDKYTQLTKCGDLDKALRGIEAARRAGFSEIKLNAVLLRGINDTEIKQLAEFAKAENMTLRFIELMPFAVQQKYANDYFISTKEIVKRYNLQYLQEMSDTKKVAFYAFDDGTRVGFISPLSNKFCSECNRIRITADGKLLNCLHECREFDIKPYIEDKQQLKDYIEACVLHKPREHHLTEGILQKRDMKNIGG